MESFGDFVFSNRFVSRLDPDFSGDRSFRRFSGRAARFVVSWTKSQIFRAKEKKKNVSFRFSFEDFSTRRFVSFWVWIWAKNRAPDSNRRARRFSWRIERRFSTFFSWRKFFPWEKSILWVEKSFFSVRKGFFSRFFFQIDLSKKDFFSNFLKQNPVETTKTQEELVDFCCEKLKSFFRRKDFFFRFTESFFFELNRWFFNRNQKSRRVKTVCWNSSKKTFDFFFSSFRIFLFSQFESVHNRETNKTTDFTDFSSNFSNFSDSIGSFCPRKCFPLNFLRFSSQSVFKGHPLSDVFWFLFNPLTRFHVKFVFVSRRKSFSVIFLRFLATRRSFKSTTKRRTNNSPKKFDVRSPKL